MNHRQVRSLDSQDGYHSGCRATQVCESRSAGCEAAIHVLCQIFEAMGTPGILLINAKNPFNLLNRSVALHNIQYTCPLLATTIINFYCAPACLFVTGVMVLSFEKDITQGCSFTMALYAVCIVPLIDACRGPSLLWTVMWLYKHGMLMMMLWEVD